jgi:ceramide glucosyltransferase
VIALSAAVGIWSFACFVFTVAALNAVRKLVRRSSLQATEHRGEWPALAILRPCEGLDPGLHENLLSTVTARYDGAREVWILVPSESDPSHAIAEGVRTQAAAVAPHVRVQVLVTRIETRQNRKVAQLMQAAARTDAPVLVVADSDLRFDDRTLPSLLAVLEADPKAGAASAPPVDVARESLGDRASAAVLSSTPHAFFCLTALAERSGGAHVLCGALIACRRAALDEVGGFASLEPYLGEDFELARRLHARGYTIPTSAAPGTVTDEGRSLGWVLKRFARWCTVTRQQRPHLFATYLLLLGATPLLVAASALTLAVGAPYARLAAGVCAVALGVRIALAVTLRRAYGFGANPLRALAALLVGELVIVVSATLALGRPLIEWRGRRYRVGEGGLLEWIP